MFVENTRIEEIRQQINERGIDALQDVSPEEAQAFLDVELGNAPQDERERAICNAYKNGALTQEYDSYFLC